MRPAKNFATVVGFMKLNRLPIDHHIGRSANAATLDGAWLQRGMLRRTIAWWWPKPDATPALFTHIRKPASYINGNTALPKNSRSGAKSKKAT